MTSFDIERRKMLQASGAALMAGLAGCTGILADGKGVPGKSPPVEENGDGNGNGSGGVPQEVDDYLSGNSANLYEGELADHTGEDEVVIQVGAGSGVAFDAPAVRVDPGATIIWEWTGNGGGHNVIHDADEPAFDSRNAHEGSTNSEAGFQYEVTLDEEGNYLYYCDPHTAVGMYGAVVVGGGGGGGGSSEVDSYLSDNGANGYEGSVTDMTGESSITINVGAGNGVSFDPVAVAVDAGTTVTWEWTGNGGGHNVIHDADEPAFDSRNAHDGSTTSEAGFQYEVTLDEAGNYPYYCNPHTSVGMYGAVVVRE